MLDGESVFKSHDKSAKFTKYLITFARWVNDE